MCFFLIWSRLNHLFSCQPHQFYIVIKCVCHKLHNYKKTPGCCSKVVDGLLVGFHVISLEFCFYLVKITLKGLVSLEVEGNPPMTD